MNLPQPQINMKNWKLIITSILGDIMLGLAGIASIPYAMYNGDLKVVAEFIPEPWKSRIMLWCGIAAIVLKVAKPIVAQFTQVLPDSSTGQEVQKDPQSRLPLPLIAFCLIPCFLLSGCSTPGQANATDPAVIAEKEANKEKWKATGAIIGKRAFQIAKDDIISAAISSMDKEKKSDFLDSAATGLRANAFEIVNSNDIADVIKIWTPKPNHWKTLAAEIADLYATANPQTDAQRQRVIEQIAEGLQQAAE